MRITRTIPLAPTYRGVDDFIAAEIAAHWAAWANEHTQESKNKPRFYQSVVDSWMSSIPTRVTCSFYGVEVTKEDVVHDFEENDWFSFFETPLRTIHSVIEVRGEEHNFDATYVKESGEWSLTIENVAPTEKEKHYGVSVHVTSYVEGTWHGLETFLNIDLDASFFPNLEMPMCVTSTPYTQNVFFVEKNGDKKTVLLFPNGIFVENNLIIADTFFQPVQELNAAFLVKDARGRHEDIDSYSNPNKTVFRERSELVGELKEFFLKRFAEKPALLENLESDLGYEFADVTAHWQRKALREALGELGQEIPEWLVFKNLS